MLAGAASALAALVGGPAGSPAAGGGVAAESSAGGAERAPSPPRLAVLPFATSGRHGNGEAAGGWLAEGFGEELVLELARRHRPRLEVLAATSSRRLADADDPLAAAAELGADHAVRGTVQETGGSLRVRVQLVRVPQPVLVWAGSYDRPLQDLPAVQREVGESIARAVALHLGLDREVDRGIHRGMGPSPASGTARGHAAASPTPDPEAYRAWLRGRHQLAGEGVAAAQAALPHLERAVTLDPGLAPAWIEVARAVRRSHPPLEARDRAVEALERALALDDSRADAHLLLGQLRLYVDLDPAAAERELLRALELAPGLAEGHHAYAGLLSSRGRHDEAVERVRRALALDPLSPVVHSDVAWFLYFAGRPGEAAEAARETLEREPGFRWARRAGILARLAAGEPDRAAELARQHVEEALANAAQEEALPRSAEGPGPSGQAAPRERLLDLLREMEAARAAGRPEAALEAYWRRLLEEARAASRQGFLSPVVLADLHAALGQWDEALAALEEAFRLRSGWTLPFLAIHPLYGPLRDDPRFQDLLARIEGASGKGAAGKGGSGEVAGGTGGRSFGPGRG